MYKGPLNGDWFPVIAFLSALVLIFILVMTLIG